MFNCSPSQFFNRNSYGVNSEKNMEGFLMNEVEGGKDEKKIPLLKKKNYIQLN